jgi:hypothetical protein
MLNNLPSYKGAPIGNESGRWRKTGIIHYCIMTSLPWVKWLEYDDDYSHPVLKLCLPYSVSILKTVSKSYLLMSDSVVGGSLHDSLSVISCIMLKMKINELIIVESKAAWPTAGYYSSISLEGKWKFTETALKTANSPADIQIQYLPNRNRSVSCCVRL